jgi:hypothetical protein
MTMDEKFGFKAMAFGFLAVLAACGGSDPLSDRQLAEKFCDLEYSCYPGFYSGYSGCVREWEDYLYDASLDSDACHDAARALGECLGKLDSCGELDAYWTEPTWNYPCYREDENVGRRCY